MTPVKVLAGIAAGVAVLLAGLVLLVFSRPCCTSGIEARQYRVGLELKRVAAAQQKFHKEHHHYAASAAELRFQPHDSDVVLQIAANDSAVEIRGRSVHLPEVACMMQATPGMWFTGRVACTPERRQR
jgi:hypothetical protein